MLDPISADLFPEGDCFQHRVDMKVGSIHGTAGTEFGQEFDTPGLGKKALVDDGKE